MTIKDLNASPFFKHYTEPPLPLKIIFRNLTIPLFTVYVHLPRHCENFCTQKRRLGFSALGIITLWRKANLEGILLGGRVSLCNTGRIKYRKRKHSILFVERNGTNLY